MAGREAARCTGARFPPHLRVHAAQAGIPFARLLKLMGHSTPDTRMRYMAHARGNSGSTRVQAPAPIRVATRAGAPGTKSPSEMGMLGAAGLLAAIPDVRAD